MPTRPEAQISAVSLATYLSYGGFTGAQKLFEFVTGQTIHPRSEFLGFFGVTGLILLIYAVVVVERSRIFYSFFGSFYYLLFYLPYRDTGVARIVYYLPGMDHFRHIAYMLSSAKWLAIICAGFGFFHLTTAKIVASRRALFSNRRRSLSSARILDRWLRSSESWPGLICIDVSAIRNFHFSDRVPPASACGSRLLNGGRFLS